MLRKFQGKIFAITEVIDALLGHLIYFMFFSIKLLRYIFSIWVYFHEYSQFIGHQGKGEATSSTPLCHFHSLHKHLDIIAGQLLQRAHLCTKPASLKYFWNMCLKWYKMIQLWSFLKIECRKYKKMLQFSLQSNSGWKFWISKISKL